MDVDMGLTGCTGRHIARHLLAVRGAALRQWRVGRSPDEEGEGLQHHDGVGVVSYS